MVYQTSPFSMILNNPKPTFQGQAILWRWISPKWLKIRPQLLWKSTRNSYAIYQMVPLVLNISQTSTDTAIVTIVLNKQTHRPTHEIASYCPWRTSRIDKRIPGLFVPLHFCSRERKDHRQNFSSRGTFVPWNIRSLVLSLPGTKVQRNEKAWSHTK